MIRFAILIATMAIATKAEAQQVYGPLPNSGNVIYWFAAAAPAPTSPKPDDGKKRTTRKAESVCAGLARLVVSCKAVGKADCAALEAQLTACKAEERACVESCTKCAQALHDKWGPATATAAPGAPAPAALSPSAAAATPATSPTGGPPLSATSGTAVPVVGAVH